MTQIVNLPALTTLTNSLVIPVADLTDNNKTKKVTLSQIVSLAAGPQGAVGLTGPEGPIGPSGPSGPGSNQSLNTNSSVTFNSITIGSTSTAITFNDGSVQVTAFQKTVRDLTEFSVGNISFTSNDLKSPILSGNPTVSGRNLYLPSASADVAGIVLIIRNRSSSYTFTVWGGLGNLATIPVTSAVQIACDGYNWFVV